MIPTPPPTEVIIAERQRELMREILNFVPANRSTLPRTRGWYERGDELAPLVSEAQLYLRLGKDDARAFLSLVGALCRALGLPDEECP